MSDEFLLDKGFYKQVGDWNFQDAKREDNPQASDNKKPGAQLLTKEARSYLEEMEEGLLSKLKNSKEEFSFEEEEKYPVDPQKRELNDRIQKLDRNYTKREFKLNELKGSNQFAENKVDGLIAKNNEQQKEAEELSKKILQVTQQVNLINQEITTKSEAMDGFQGTTTQMQFELDAPVQNCRKEKKRRETCLCMTCNIF